MKLPGVSAAVIGGTRQICRRYGLAEGETRLGLWRSSVRWAWYQLPGQRCSLGTHTVLGLVTNGLLALLPDGGAENWSLRLPGNPKVVPPDCPFDIFSASSSGSASRLLKVAGLTGCVVNAEVLSVLARKAATPAIRISVLLISRTPVRTT